MALSPSEVTEARLDRDNIEATVDALFARCPGSPNKQLYIRVSELADFGQSGDVLPILKSIYEPVGWTVKLEGGTTPVYVFIANAETH